MGFFTSYDLRGWGPSGRFLSAFEKEEIQDYVFDEGVEDCGCSHSNTDEHIMSFCDSSYHAYDRVRNALTDFASRRPGFLLELDFSSEAEDHERIRFKGNEVEELTRIELFPPFVKLTRKDDESPLPVLEFNFSPVCGNNEAHILVLLDRRLYPSELEKLEDRIAFYCDGILPCNPDQLIHDVFSSEGINHLILKPSHSFTI